MSSFYVFWRNGQWFGEQFHAKLSSIICTYLIINFFLFNKISMIIICYLGFVPTQKIKG